MNDFLKNMSEKDLNQRFAESYFLYKGLPMFCYNIKMGHITYKRDPDTEAKIEVFDYREVSTMRPKSGWFNYARGGLYLYACLGVERQYHRGLTSNNCLFYTGTRQVGGHFNMYNTLLAQMGEPASVEQLKIGKAGVFKKHLHQTDANELGISQLYFRATNIGQVSRERREISLKYRRYIQEVKEAIVDCQDYRFV